MRYARPGFPPAIVFYGTNDKWKTGWDALRDKLKKVGNESVRVMLAEGQPHGFFNREPWRSITLIEADRFLEKLGMIAGPLVWTAPSGAEKLVPERVDKPAESKANGR